MFPSSTKFLVVDDFSTMRKIVKKILAELGYTNIVETVDGKNAYETLLAESKTPNPIEFIISDWQMPNLTGIEFLEKCRSSEEFKNIPFMLVTAESEKGQIVQALKLNVSEYVIKPFTPAILKEKLGSVYLKSQAKKAS